MANIEKLHWVLSQLGVTNEKELETLLMEVLTPEMIRNLSSPLDTFAWHRENLRLENGKIGLTQPEIAEKIGQIYQEMRIEDQPPRQQYISKFETGSHYPKLKPDEMIAWARAYGLTFDEFARLVRKTFSGPKYRKVS